MINRVANRDVHDDNSWVSERDDLHWPPSSYLDNIWGRPTSYLSPSSTGGSSPSMSSSPTSKDNAAHETDPTSLVTSTAPQQTYGDGGPLPTSSGSANVVNRPNLPTSAQFDSSHSITTIHIVAAVILPLIFMAILGVILFFYLRRRRRQKAQAKVQEMKTQTSSNYRRPNYAIPPVQPPPAVSPIAPQPVILGPIVPGSNGAYYTGIDTSDVVSMHETTGTGNPFVDQSDPHDEPPPPYRPRSIAATISRNTSLRQAPLATLSETNLMAVQGQIHQSPFADRHDDAISEFSEPTRRRFGRRNEDELSAVSDLSYQQDPVIVRPTV